MEDNKKRQLNEEELEQVAGGVLNPIHVEWRPTPSYEPKCYYCDYCGIAYTSQDDLKTHMMTCWKNPNRGSKP